MTRREGRLYTFPFASPARLVLGLPLMRREDAPETLANYVRRRRNALGLSLIDVEAQSRRAGTKIAGSYVSRIENTLAKNPSKDKLIALANGLGVSKEEVFAAATGGGSLESSPLQMTLEPDEIRLLLCYRDMTFDSRDNALAIVETLHHSERRRAEKKKTA